MPVKFAEPGRGQRPEAGRILAGRIFFQVSLKNMLGNMNLIPTFAPAKKKPKLLSKFFKRL